MAAPVSTVPASIPILSVFPTVAGGSVFPHQVSCSQRLPSHLGRPPHAALLSKLRIYCPLWSPLLPLHLVQGDTEPGEPHIPVRASNPPGLPSSPRTQFVRLCSVRRRRAVPVRSGVVSVPSSLVSPASRTRRAHGRCSADIRDCSGEQLGPDGLCRWRGWNWGALRGREAGKGHENSMAGEWGDEVGPHGCCPLIISTSSLDEARGPGNHSLEKMCPRRPRGCDHSFQVSEGQGPGRRHVSSGCSPEWEEGGGKGG